MSVRNTFLRAATLCSRHASDLEDRVRFFTGMPETVQLRTLVNSLDACASQAREDEATLRRLAAEIEEPQR